MKKPEDISYDQGSVNEAQIPTTTEKQIIDLFRRISTFKEHLDRLYGELIKPNTDPTHLLDYIDNLANSMIKIYDDFHYLIASNQTLSDYQKLRIINVLNDLEFFSTDLDEYREWVEVSEKRPSKTKVLGIKLVYKSKSLIQFAEKILNVLRE
jgi:hypothetical protein